MVTCDIRGHVCHVHECGVPDTGCPVGLLEAEIDRLRAEVAKLRTGDVFWPVGSDRDLASSSPCQWANDEGVAIGTILEFDVAHQLPHQYFEAMPDPHDPNSETAWLELREMTKEEFEARASNAD